MNVDFKQIQSIGKQSVIVLWAGLLPLLSVAHQLDFSASVDPTEISLEDTVDLKFTLKMNEESNSGQSPEFQAPDFDVVGESSSLSVSSSFNSQAQGFSTVQIKEIVKSLKPLRTGKLKITQIQWNSAGKTWRAPDLGVEVVGSSTVPLQRQRMSRRQLPGMNFFGRTLPQKQQKVGLRLHAETSRDTYFKGEQIIVNYYLDHSIPVANLQIEEFPMFSGFLKEDLEVPTSGQSLHSESIVLQGVPYQRTLLGRYAAYPLETGTLKLDGMALRLSYQAGMDSLSGDDDLFFGMLHQVVPQVWSGRGDPLSLKILPLPQEGQPSSFTGGVGHFKVTSAVSRNQVRVHESVTWVIQVEGTGNFTHLKAPVIQLGPQVEFYDSKKKKSVGKHGGGHQTFEFIIIPRVAGKLTLPRVEFGFFDPVKKSYYVQSIDPVDIEVESSLTTQSAAQADPVPPQETSSQEDLSPPVGRSALPWHWIGRVVRRFLVGGLILGISWLLWRWVRQQRVRREKSSQYRHHWKRVRMRATHLSELPWKQVVEFYQELVAVIGAVLQKQWNIQLLSVSRVELKEILVEEKKIALSTWESLEAFLAFSEAVQFASTMGGIIEKQAREQGPEWFKQMEVVIQVIQGGEK